MDAAAAEEPELLFRNFYRCGDCGNEWDNEWDDEWSCACDDDCPECGSRHWTPYKSEDIDGGVE